MRLDTRPDHVAFLKKLNAAGTLKFAGPFLDDDGKPMRQPGGDRGGRQGRGREAIGADDPYAKAGLFESVEIKRLELDLQQSGKPSNAVKEERR